MVEDYRIPKIHEEFFAQISETEARPEVLNMLAQYLCQLSIDQERDQLSLIESNPERRILKDYSDARALSDAYHRIGHRIVLTSGSFDLFHIGHARYLDKASKHGDVLFVGVDSDDKIKKRKGPSRPVVGESERMSTLCHVKGVDFIVLKETEEEKWGLIKTIRPDVLIATEGTYTSDEVKALEESYVGEVRVLTPQATTSTSARIRLTNIISAEKEHPRNA